MFTFSPEAVVIYDSVLYQRTGAVGRWANSLERRFVLHAQEAAPIRSGELAGSIVGDTDLNPAAKTAVVTIASLAEHSMYVLAGTTGPIMADKMWAFWNATGDFLPKGGRMALRPGNGYGATFEIMVRGQDAQNFLAVAAERTAVTNRSLRGFRPEFGY